MELDPRSAREFSEALQKFADARKIDNATACNLAAQRVAVRAYANTKTADPAHIEEELGHIVGHALTFTKSGKISKSKRSRMQSIISTTSLAYNLVAARTFRRVGKAGMPKSIELQRQAGLLIRKRVASAGFIRSGWIPAIRRLAQVAGAAFISTRARAGKGSVRMAKPGHNVFAEITNASVTEKNKTSEAALIRVGGEGLTRAIDETREEMNQIVSEQMDKAAAKFNNG